MKEIKYPNKYIFAIFTLEKRLEYKNILTFSMFIASRCCCVIVVVLLSGVCVTNPGDQWPAPAPMLLVSADARHKCGREQPQPSPAQAASVLSWGHLLVLISNIDIYIRDSARCIYRGLCCRSPLPLDTVTVSLLRVPAPDTFIKMCHFFVTQT